MPVTINGDGLIEVGGTSTTQGRVRLAEDTDNGSNYVELTAPASVTANRTVTFPDSSGTVLTTGAVVTAAQGGTGLSSPGASGNILTSDGTNWTSAAPASSFVGFRGQAFTSNGTFTIPTGITAVKVTVVGGGGGSGGVAGDVCIGDGISGGGGGGGAAISFLTGLTPGNTLSVTVGAGGTAGTTGGGVANAGGTGGSSSVASGTQSITTITGGGGVGSGGAWGSVFSAGGNGGTGTNGSFNCQGIPGSNSAGAVPFGGSSIFGGGAKPGNMFTSVTGTAGGPYGGGASGSRSNSGTRSGAAGGAGIVIFEW